MVHKELQYIACMTASRESLEPLTARLGRAVRLARGVRGMSRRALAQRSGVSTRFLADIEAGTANASLRSLEAVAGALDVPLVALLTAPAAPTAARIALLGLRGAGKSTVGRRLAQRLGLPFVELDSLIEEAAGLALGPIFELHGERYFRRLERESLARLVAGGSGCVLATGGGLVTEPETWGMLRETFFTVWLAARPEDHYRRVLDQGDRRPMAGNPDAMKELQALLTARRALYRQAHLTVDSSALDVDTVVTRIAAAVPGRTPLARGRRGKE